MAPYLINAARLHLHGKHFFPERSRKEGVCSNIGSNIQNNAICRAVQNHVCESCHREGLNCPQMVAPAPFQRSKAADGLQLRPSPKHMPNGSKRWAERWAARLGGKCVAYGKHEGHFPD